jgi:hypothetical protein
MTRRTGFVVAICAIAALTLVSSCRSGTSGGGGHLSLSATTTSDGGNDGGTDGGSVVGLDLGNGIVLTEVRFLVRRIVLDKCPRLAQCDACQACSTRDDEHDDCGDCDECEEANDVKAGPALVDLQGSDLSGGVKGVLDTSVASGDYSEAKIVVAQASEQMVTDHPELAPMKSLHASIVLDGTIDGDAFEFATPMHVQQERCGPFTVGTDTSALTLTVDPSGWFVDHHGTRLDPRAHHDRGDILANLRRSLRLKAKEDGEHDDDEGAACVCPASDAGLPDGGGPDAGAPDAGAPDAGTTG